MISAEAEVCGGSPPLTLLTPSYVGDRERCRLLCESTLRHGGGAPHLVIVPGRDLRGFTTAMSGLAHVRLIAEEDYLPWWLIRLPIFRRWRLNLTGFPVRGWIAQQIVKLAAASQAPSERLVILDSDTWLIADLDAERRFVDAQGRWRLLSVPGRGATPEHHPWHRQATRLLGLPSQDYCGKGWIGNVVCWRRSVVEQLCAQLSARHGRDWRIVLAGQTTLSEYILYGVFVEQVLGAAAAGHWCDAENPVLEHWAETALDEAALTAFFARLTPAHRAVMISAKSGTAFAGIRARISALT